jgi:LacI family repressor for deo operon, udp, cdd, tsx, nupC, and nupG
VPGTRRVSERRVRLADVARDAGTSESTASRALKDDPRIGEATRAAVRASAAKLGYVPNAAARSLRARRTHILGLLLDDLADPVHGQLAAGVEESAAGQGYAVFMMTGLHDPARERRALRAFVEHRADGIVLASCVSDPAEVYTHVPQRAVVFVQPEYPALAAQGAVDRGVLRSDDDAGMTATVRHLLERGYRRLAYVGAGGGPSDLLRRAAAGRALDGLGDEPLRIYDAGLAGWRDPSVVADELARDRPDAAICYDDKLALALMDALRLTDLDVPADLAIVGFDGIASAGRSRPRLTTVAVPSVEFGRRAVGMLMASARDGVAQLSEVMPVRLVIGETTPQRDVVRRSTRSAEALVRASRARAS